MKEDLEEKERVDKKAAAKEVTERTDKAKSDDAQGIKEDPIKAKVTEMEAETKKILALKNVAAGKPAEESKDKKEEEPKQLTEDE